MDQCPLMGTDFYMGYSSLESPERCSRSSSFKRARVSYLEGIVTTIVRGIIGFSLDLVHQ